MVRTVVVLSAALLVAGCASVGDPARDPTTTSGAPLSRPSIRWQPPWLKLRYRMRCSRGRNALDLGSAKCKKILKRTSLSMARRSTSNITSAAFVALSEQGRADIEAAMAEKRWKSAPVKRRSRRSSWPTKREAHCSDRIRGRGRSPECSSFDRRSKTPTRERPSAPSSVWSYADPGSRPGCPRLGPLHRVAMAVADVRRCGFQTETG